MKQKKGILVVVFCLLLAAAALLVWRYMAPAAAEGEKSITINVTYADGTEESYPLTTEAAYLLEAAEEVLTLEGEDTQYGFTVHSINGELADFTSSNTYWALYVNGEYGTLGVENQPLEDGGVYAFVYESY